MTEEECLETFGWPPQRDRRAELLELLQDLTEAERRRQGAADTQAMRFVCAALFLNADVSDVLAIWRAKTASMDADASLETELMLGAGLEATLEFLRTRPGPETSRLEERIRRYLDSEGDEFDPARKASELHGYYG